MEGQEQASSVMLQTEGTMLQEGVVCRVVVLF